MSLILDHLIDASSRTAFAIAWANDQEEKGVRLPAKQDILDIAPPTPKRWRGWGIDLWKQMFKANRVDSAEALLEKTGLGAPDVWTDDELTEFAHYIACEALRIGVRWDDSHEKHGLKVPSKEFDGGEVDDEERENPRRVKRNPSSKNGSVHIVKPGKLKDGIWEGEVVSEVRALTDMLEDLGLKHLAKTMSDTQGVFDSEYSPPASEVAGLNRSKVPSEAIEIFADASVNAYRSAWENSAEGYFVQTVTKNFLDLLNESSGTARYDDVKIDFEVRAREEGDINGIFSDPFIKVTISNPGHFSNYVETLLGYQGGEPVDSPLKDSGLSQLLAMLKSEVSGDIKNIGEVDTSNADMDWDLFKETFESNVSEMSPAEIAECLQTYAKDNDLTVKEVYEKVEKLVHARAGAIASALKGGYDPRQGKLFRGNPSKEDFASQLDDLAATGSVKGLMKLAKEHGGEDTDEGAAALYRAQAVKARLAGDIQTAVMHEQASEGWLDKLRENSSSSSDKHRIAVSFATTTPESAEAGDYAETGWEDEEGHDCEPADEDETAADLAVKFLKGEGGTEASSSHFHKDVWYTQPDGSTDYRTGEEKILSFHLKGFTVEEQKEVFERMKRAR